MTILLGYAFGKTRFGPLGELDLVAAVESAASAFLREFEFFLTVTLFGGQSGSLPRMLRAKGFAANYHDNDAYSGVRPDSASHRWLWLWRGSTAWSFTKAASRVRVFCLCRCCP